MPMGLMLLKSLFINECVTDPYQTTSNDFGPNLVLKLNFDTKNYG